MNKVEQIEGQVKNLTRDELTIFRNWFAQFDADLWDQEIEADAKRGALLSLAEDALADHLAGRSTIL